MSNLKSVIAAGLTGLMLVACKPAEPPPDLVKTQRDALNKAKAVEGVLQQSQERTRDAEGGTK